MEIDDDPNQDDQRNPGLLRRVFHRLSNPRSTNLTRRFFIGGSFTLLVLLFGATLIGNPYSYMVPSFQERLKNELEMSVAFLELAVANVEDPGKSSALWSRELAEIPRFDHFETLVYSYPERRLLASSGIQTDMHDRRGFGRLLERAYIWGARNIPNRVFADRDAMVAAAISEEIAMGRSYVAKIEGGSLVVYGAAPVLKDGQQVSTLVMSSHQNYFNSFGNRYMSNLIGVFALAALFAFAFAIALSSEVSRPLNLLAKAANAGKGYQFDDNLKRKFSVPEIAKRGDVIGRLAQSLTEMTNALYNRIEVNERFAADVAHEVKNPLASMRSAVETLRVAKSPDDRSELLDVLELDVKRLDRMVSDISNASRLDAELVASETQNFNLTKMLSNIVEFHRSAAEERGIALIWEPPNDRLDVNGLEERLAQVFVNLLINAISFCEEGDAIRIWARKRGKRILAVVEDTGPGIPEMSLTDIFQRFYSQRAGGDFGQHSGLGLSISKQIVEAHGGTIWAENIRHPDEEDGHKVLGARFVVGLPL